jgi:hypothetical protein
MQIHRPSIKQLSSIDALWAHAYIVLEIKEKTEIAYAVLDTETALH